MRKPLVAGNWKMNGASDSINALLAGIVEGTAQLTHVEVAVCPPFVLLPATIQAVAGTPIAVGAQNVAAMAAGAYTGEVSAAMLADIGCDYVIVGHSERRALYHETDAIIATKLAIAQQANVTPILCVGEQLAEREAGTTESVIEAQLQAVIEQNGINTFAHLVIAYEPVWAIGTGKTATPEQAQAVHAFIRTYLAGHQSDMAQSIRILYGGSMKSNNAKQLLAQPDIDGGLIGGASLMADDFVSICRSAAM